MKKIVITIAIVLSGCASSGVTSIGQDTFMISDRASNGYTPAGTLKSNIYREALAYCGREGKEFQPLREHMIDGQPNSWHWASAEIQFRCLNKGDPELSRPTMRPEANIKIENDIRVKKEIQIKDSSDKSSGDMYSELKKLKDLLDSKIITQSEFNEQKKTILDKYK